MTFSYPSTLVHDVIGSKSPTNVITPVTLTAAYDVAGNTKVFEVAGYTKMNLDILYTTGAGETDNSIDVRIEASPDATNFYRIPNEEITAGVSTLTQRELKFVGAASATAYTISIGLDIFYKYVKVSVKETGVVTNNGTAYVGATLCGQ